jgi:hypothetical protein
MDEAELLRRLQHFGAPFFVPAGEWRVAGVDGSVDETDGVLVFDATGTITVRTELGSYPPTTVEHSGRRVRVAGDRSRFGGLRVARVDELTLTGRA